MWVYIAQSPFLYIRNEKYHILSLSSLLIRTSTYGEPFHRDLFTVSLFSKNAFNWTLIESSHVGTDTLYFLISYQGLSLPTGQS